MIIYGKVVVFLEYDQSTLEYDDIVTEKFVFYWSLELKKFKAMHTVGANYYSSLYF